MSTNQYREYHHNIPDMEFSAFFDMTTNNIGDRVIYLKYFLFIKYEGNIYIEVKSVGYIIMPFEELLKNKLLKMYYELSLLLVKDKNRFVEKTGIGDNDDEITDIYKGRRNWFIDCAYILNKEIHNNKHYCYFEMNPFEWKDPDCLWIDPYTGNCKTVNTSSEIEWFNYNYNVRLGYEISSYEKRFIVYVNIAVEYIASLMEKELNEISAVEEDKQNIIKLITLNDKKGMNSDLLMIIYNNIVSADENGRYRAIMNDLENYKHLESVAQILSA